MKTTVHNTITPTPNIDKGTWETIESNLFRLTEDHPKRVMVYIREKFDHNTETYMCDGRQEIKPNETKAELTKFTGESVEKVAVTLVRPDNQEEADKWNEVLELALDLIKDAEKREKWYTKHPDPFEVLKHKFMKKVYLGSESN